MPSRKASIGSAEAFFRVATGWRGRQQSGYGRCRQSGMEWARSRRKRANRSTRRSRPWSSRVTAKVSPLGRIQMSSRSFDTSIPANTSTSRPCTCGLAMRPRRLFGMLGWTDGAPCSRTGSCTPGAKRQRDRWEIQGARRATWRSRSRRGAQSKAGEAVRYRAGLTGRPAVGDRKGCHDLRDMRGFCRRRPRGEGCGGSAGRALCRPLGGRRYAKPRGDPSGAKSPRHRPQRDDQTARRRLPVR
jgi:hypothetical protein